MLGYVGHDEITLVPVARFPNNPVRTIDGLHWNILELYRNVSSGLGAAARQESDIRSIGVDSWAADYALILGDRMLGNPYHYRDERTEDAVSRTHGVRSFEQLYAANGLQFLPFNTVYQLIAERRGDWLEHADSLLLIPDLINFWLSGSKAAELTNASTTGLLNAHSQMWDDGLIDAFGFPRALLPDLITPGEQVGEVTAGVTSQLDLRSRIPVTAVGSHDTASAVAAVPALTDDFAYISSGTWSLVGVELEHPVITQASRMANFTNEGGVDGRIRFLKNVSGLWLLSESIRTWGHDEGTGIELGPLLEQAASVTRDVPTFDASDQRFIAPGDMPRRIAEWCNEHGHAAPQTKAEIARSILESLATAYAETLEQAAQLSGKTIEVIHVVGGGSQNALLCQLTANKTGRPVIAGPVEATAIGNVLIQARSRDMIRGTLETLRNRVSVGTPLRRFVPQA